MRSEKDKMLAGELYDPFDLQLSAERIRARNLAKTFNELRVDEKEERDRILQELLGTMGEDVWIEPPFFCDYGTNITLGNNVFFNFNCVILDPTYVNIGSNVLFGPGVHIYTATHPLSATQRRTYLEFAKPVEIGSDVWVGGGVIICPGVKIGSRSVIGAGSVVTKNIPEGVLAVGNPCRVIREIDEGECDRN